MMRLALVIVLLWYGCVNWAFGSALGDLATPLSISPTTEGREQSKTLFIVTADGKVTIYASEAEMREYLTTGVANDEERGIIMMALEILRLRAKAQPKFDRMGRVLTPSCAFAEADSDASMRRGVTSGATAYNMDGTCSYQHWEPRK